MIGKDFENDLADSSVDHFIMTIMVVSGSDAILSMDKCLIGDETKLGSYCMVKIAHLVM